MRLEEEDFKTVKLINASMADVFNTLVTLNGLAANWQQDIPGEANSPKRIILEQGNGVQYIIKPNIQLPQLTQWTVLSDAGLNNDWENTIIRFELEDMGDETCTLHFMHIGLTPEIESYPSYVNYWQLFINDIINQSEHAQVS